MKKTLRTALNCCFLGLLLFCGTAQGAQKPELPRVVYGFDREFPPFSYEDPGGKPVGFEVELLEAVLRGRANLVTRPMQWENVITELAGGSITVTSGMAMTEQRAKNYGLSARPSFTMQIRFFTKIYKRVPNSSLMRGQPVSVDDKSYQMRLLESFGGVNIKPYPPKTAGLRALYNDEVAAWCGPTETTYYYINKLNYGAITTVGASLGEVEIHFAVNRDRGDILRIINDGMKAVVESGEYDRLYRKWFVKDLTGEEQSKMIAAAKDATITSYAPYGKRSVGAAVLTATGKIFTACNVENADPALNLSALIAATGLAVAEGEMEIRGAVITDPDGKLIAPTAKEAQFLYEFGRGIQIMRPTADGKLELPMLTDILPNPVAIKNRTPLNVD